MPLFWLVEVRLGTLCFRIAAKSEIWAPLTRTVVPGKIDEAQTVVRRQLMIHTKSATRNVGLSHECVYQAVCS